MLVKKVDKLVIKIKVNHQNWVNLELKITFSPEQQHKFKVEFFNNQDRNQ